MTTRHRIRTALVTWFPAVSTLIAVALGALAFYINSTAQATLAPLQNRISVIETQQKADKESMQRIEEYVVRIDHTVTELLINSSKK